MKSRAGVHKDIEEVACHHVLSSTHKGLQHVLSGLTLCRAGYFPCLFVYTTSLHEAEVIIQNRHGGREHLGYCGYGEMK